MDFDKPRKAHRQRAQKTKKFREDKHYGTYFGSEAQTGTLQFFGRQFYFGASYKF